MELKEKLEIISEKLFKLDAPIEIVAASMIDYHTIDKALKILNENSKITLEEYVNKMEIDY